MTEATKHARTCIYVCTYLYVCRVSQVALMIKNLPANAGNIRDTYCIPESGRSPGGGNGNPFQYSCWRNPMDRGSLQSTVHEVTKESNMTEHAHQQMIPAN